MRKKHIMLIMLVMIVLISGVFLLKNKDSTQLTKGNSDDLTEEIEETSKEKTITYENGDIVYLPSSDDISYDHEEEIYYYEGLLNIYLSSEITSDQADELAETIDGTVVGKIEGSINMLQVQIEESSMDELNQLADHLQENELVEFAQISIPSFITDLNDSNSSKDKEVVDPHWWAKTINAPAVWDFVDQYENRFKKVKVGVLERGRLGVNETEVYDNDLKESVVEVDNSDGRKFKTVNRKNEAVIDSHARWVTKFIAADEQENRYDFRGVASGVADVHFTSIGNDALSKKIINDVPEPYVFAIIESQLNSGVRIINNSWGTPPKSKEKWKKSSSFWIKEGITYKGYLKGVKNSANEVSKQLIVALDRILSAESNNISDFLIIQGAGNGESRFEHDTDEDKDEAWTAETATNASNSGLFANINQETYDAAKDISESIETELEDIQNRIVIVGGAEWGDNGKAYHSPEWASYGDVIDVAAPASNLLIDTDILKEDDQIKVRGTSFAAPMVSGTAAIIWSYNPNLTAREVKNLLIKHSEHHVKDERDKKVYTYPLLNMTAFLDGYIYYNDLLEKYRTAIKEQWDSEKLLKEGLGMLQDYSEPVIFDDYGYEFRDINGDGVPELILGIYQEDGTAEVHEIYALQDGKPVITFVSGIRTHVNIFQDGTISSSYGIRSMEYYQLNNDGTRKVVDGYHLHHDGGYQSLLDSDKIMTESDIEALHEKYTHIGLMNHSFTPFAKKEETVPDSEKSEEVELSDDDVKNIMKENYSRLEEILLEDSINHLYDKHHTIEEAQNIWESGVKPNSPFYQEVYDLLYPKVENLVADEGMESLINQKYSMFWQPPAVISFYGPEYALEVLEKEATYFKLKQTKKIGPHEAGGDYHYLIYHVKYVKEAGEWKFAGAIEQK